MKNNKTLTVGEIAANDFRAAAVFSKYGIDFCCGGGQTLEDACKSQNVNVAKLQKELDAVAKGTEKCMDFDSWSLTLLASYIEETYHTYIRESIPLILANLGKINEVHGKIHPELAVIYELFSQSANDLTAHLQKEENILFPQIREIAATQKLGKHLVQGHYMSVQNPIYVMTKEHDNEGERYKKIRKLSHDYHVPDDGCNTYQVAYKMLSEFEKKLHEHIHLENNILFPKAVEMEKALC